MINLISNNCVFNLVYLWGTDLFYLYTIYIYNHIINVPNCTVVRRINYFILLFFILFILPKTCTTCPIFYLKYG